MRILEWEQFLNEGLPGGGAAVTIGIFDGVHRGHQALIERIVKQGKLIPVIITFKRNLKRNENGEHPLTPGENSGSGDLSSFAQRIALFKEMGIGVTVIADLTGPLRTMTGARFLTLLRVRGRMAYLAVGSNFRCGYEQDTDAEKIRAMNKRARIPTDIVEVLAEDGAPVSSSRIRAAVAEGNFEEAKALLGRPFTLDITSARMRSDRSGGGKMYYIETPGAVLPPPGAYTVLLWKSTRDPRHAEIEIRDKTLKMPYFPNYDFIEFL